ncbi:AsnC family transcriptional regulator [Aureimonas endophytica]|uniref:AsnC family transcriptional regulator n=1 Tax=Aureimonas endophytica TaxID=2027858 RepID=A0A917ECX1_9HYPH|nr:Lrp/AsnC family transcriptional regulator [Aureimonas endophytica]GGE20314.1 AsnC family transcriptional regulator [Aureimonas endophytica]
MPAHRLDDQDRAILRLLQEDATRPQREIAEAVHLSAPAVQRRIARMEKEGIIRRTVAVVDPVAVGLPITVLVEVTLTNDRSATVSAVKAFFREAPEVQQCYCVTGTAGFVLVLLVPSMEDYETRTARLFADNEMVRSYRTIVVLDRVKTTTSLPI